MKKQIKFELVLIVLFLSSCSPIGNEVPEEKSGAIISEVPASGEEDKTAAEEEYAEVALTENQEVPWGFDQASYEVYKSGVLDPFIPPKSSVEQCELADLDLDGIDDILFCMSIPPTEKPDDHTIYEYQMNSVILKGIGENAYEFKAENKLVNYHSYYDGDARIQAGDGWFRFARQRGTAGGYVYSYLFEYDAVREDWFLAEHYYNKYGYFANGLTMIETPAQFGIVTFEDYGKTEQDRLGVAENERTVLFNLNECSVDMGHIKVSVSDGSWLSAFKDQEKGRRINELAVNDINYVIEQLSNKYQAADLSLSVGYSYSGPDIISLCYGLHGTIEDKEVHRYFTTMIDIKEERRLRLTDIIDADKLNEIIETQGFSADMPAEDIKAAETIYFSLPEAERMELFESADDLKGVLNDGKNTVFCTVYEKSLCFYFQSNQAADYQIPEMQKWYIDIEDIRPAVKKNCWEHQSNAAVHIEWKG